MYSSVTLGIIKLMVPRKALEKGIMVQRSITSWEWLFTVVKMLLYYNKKKILKGCRLLNATPE